MTSISSSVRIAARSLRRSAGLSLAIIASLAISIGAVTTVFSVVDSVLLRALPFRNADKLVWLSSVRPQRADAPFSLPEFLDYAAEARTLELAAFTSWNASMETSDGAIRLQGMRLSANAFEVLGTSASAGRLLRSDDDSASAPRVAVLSYGFWQVQFGGAPSVVGQTIRLNGEAYAVVGVLPRHFPLPLREVDVAVPLAPLLDPRRSVRTSVNFLRVFGVARSVTVPVAQREMTALAADLVQRFPSEYATRLGVQVMPLHEYLVGGSRQILVVTLGAAGLLMAVALANVLNLLLIRGIGRQGEMALRRALGASRFQMAIGATIEAALLAGAGALLGVGLATATVALVAASAVSLPRLAETRVDLRTLAFVIAIAAVSALLFSAIPLVSAWRAAPRQALAALGRGQHGVRGQSRARALFLVAQVSLAVLLVVMSATMVTSLARLQRVELGYRPDSTFVARVTLPPARYRTSADVARFSRELEGELLASPGVVGAGVVSVAPLSGLLFSVPFSIPGRSPLEHRDQPNANLRAVSPGYFAAIRASVAQGRSFTHSDDEQAARVALVSQAFANRYFEGADPLRRDILIDDNNTGPRPLAIVGVMRDMRHLHLDGAPTYDIFIPVAQVHPDGLAFITGSQFWAMRVASAPSSASSVFSRAITRIDRDVAVARVRPMTDYVAEVLAPRRVSVATLLGFAGVALLLATIGVYSVIAYSVEQRRREIGLRLALGASGADVARHVMRPAVLLSAAGVILGLGGAVATRRVVAGLLFGVTPTEPLLLGLVAALLIGMSCLAAAIPTRRATRIDPAIALAGE